MALYVKKGSFASQTSTGNQVISFTPNAGDPAWTPKAVILWGNQLTAAGYGVGLAKFLGAATAAGGVSAQVWDEDGLTTTNNSRKISDSSLFGMVGTDQTTLQAGGLVSFGSNTFTIDWTDAADSAWIIHYLALGGATLTNAKHGTFTSAAATGDQSFTGVGFQPDYLLVFGNSLGSVSASAAVNFNIGMASSASRMGSASIRGRDNVADTAYTTDQRTDKIISTVGSSAETTLHVASLKTFDADGFTITFDSSSAQCYGYLALKGGSYFVGNETQPVAPGLKTTAGIGFPPRALFGMSTNITHGTAFNTANGKMSIFGADAFNEGGIWVQGADNVGNTDVDSRTVTTKAMGFSTQPSTTDAEADLSRFNSDGFTLDWTTADATAREFIFTVFGDPEDVSIGKGRSLLLGVQS